MAIPLTAIEQSFLAIDTATTSQAIAVFCPLAALPDIERVRAQAKNLTRRFPRMAQVLSTNQKCWIDGPLFDPAKHIEVREISSASEKDVFIAAAGKLFAEPFNFSQPLWKCYVLCTEQSCDTAAALLFKLHHSFADGLGGMTFFDAFCDSPVKDLTPVSNNKATLDLPHRAKETIKVGASLLKLLSEHAAPTPPFPLIGANSSARELYTTEISLAEIKKIKSASHTTLNDVVLAVLTGALRRYFTVHDLSIRDVRAIMPVSLRTERARDTLGNDLTAVGVTMPISLSHPLDQLREIHRSISELKASGGFGAYAVLSNLIAHIPAPMQRLLCEQQAKKTHFICTNLPGPKTQRTFGGAPVLGIFPMAALLRNHGVAFGFLSYAETLCLSVVSDPAIAPDARIFLDYFQESFAELKKVIALPITSQAA